MSALAATADAPVSPEQIQDAVARTGMSAEPWREEKSALAEEGFWERNRRTLLTAVSGAFLLAGAQRM